MAWQDTAVFKETEVIQCFWHSSPKTDWPGTILIVCVCVEFSVIDVYMGNLYNIGTDHWIYPIQKKLNNIKHLLQHS